ncbi:peroxidase 12 [Cryptomeria japonica]|uniref:peroxidase 12 n=1 Tax=Cryptomeria japonica TaxID=3369 RepID=UPI0027DA4EBB|nr:peroxidase 12 [Cryptomeria japonica]
MVSLAEMVIKYRGPIVCFLVVTGAWNCGCCNGQSIDVDDLPEPVDGLSWTFYNTSCPNLESIVKSTLDTFFDDDITQAAGLLRLHFHDCFVQGCDASILLNITDNSSERQQIPNLTLRDMAFTIIDQIKVAVEANCSGVVSCADILTLAARDSVAKSGGPEYPVPLGRRDSTTFANSTTVLANLPAPTSNVDELVGNFSNKGLNMTDLVALSGGHTIGVGHCGSFQNRLYNITTGVRVQDPTLNQTFASNLYLVCPVVNDTVNFTNLDLQTPDDFDNDYYLNVQNNQSLFTSDQTLYDNSTTQGIVDTFASNQTLFFTDFILGMLKMGQLDVLTGTEGEIRSNCSVANSASANDDQGIRSMVDSGEDLASSFHSV